MEFTTKVADPDPIFLMVGEDSGFLGSGPFFFFSRVWTCSFSCVGSGFLGSVADLVLRVSDLLYSHVSDPDLEFYVGSGLFNLGYSCRSDPDASVFLKDQFRAQFFQGGQI